MGHLVRLCLILTILAGLSVEAGSTARPKRPMLRVAVEGHGTVATRGRAIDCGRRCSATFKPGRRVELDAGPDSYFAFSGWQGGCVGVALGCLLSVDRSTTVRAIFERMEGTLYMTVTGPGAIAVEPGDFLVRGGFSQAVPQGVRLTFTPRPDPGAVFKGWGDTCAAAPLDACTFRPEGEANVAAAFGQAGSEQGQGTLTVQTVGYSSTVRSVPPGIDCPPACVASFPAGTAVSLRDETSYPVRWFWGGACEGQAQTCMLVMDTSLSVTAAVPPDEVRPVFSARVTVGGPGTVTDESAHIRCGRGGSACFAQVVNGQSLRLALVATPAPGARFAGWGGGCHGSSRSCHVVSPGTLDVNAFFRRLRR